MNRLFPGLFNAMKRWLAYVLCVNRFFLGLSNELMRLLSYCLMWTVYFLVFLMSWGDLMSFTRRAEVDVRKRVLNGKESDFVDGCVVSFVLQMRVANYWEALGVMAAHKAGVDPLALRRNRVRHLRRSHLSSSQTSSTPGVVISRSTLAESASWVTWEVARMENYPMKAVWSALYFCYFSTSTQFERIVKKFGARAWDFHSGLVLWISLLGCQQWTENPFCNTFGEGWAANYPQAAVIQPPVSLH